MTRAKSDDGAVRRKVLVVAPFVPAIVASHGASAAIGGTLSALVEHHDVSLIYMRGPEEPPLDEKLAAELEIVREVQRPTRPTGVVSRCALLARLLRGRPMWVQDWWSAHFADELLKIVDLWAPDVVHVELSVMAPYVRALRDTEPKVVFTIHDPAVPAALIELRRQRGVQWPLHLLDAWAWRRAERAAARAADRVVVFTEADARTLAKSTRSTPVCVIPLGTNLPDRDDGEGSERATALFVGSARHPPNEDAVRRLCSDVMPRVVSIEPEAHLRIVGHYPRIPILDEMRSHITMAGRVEDVRAELRRAAVVVAPIQLGGGMRVKVVDALVAGKAVVGTSKAFAGMSAAEEGAAICADDDATFAAAVARLMSNDDERNDLGHRARAWAEAHLAWSTALARYDQMYASFDAGQGSGVLSGDVIRRLDWRFLLPTPDAAAFDRLVILGADAQLAHAAHSVWVADNVHTTLDGVRDADAVAVLAGARPRAERISAALRPGGVVYWEADRTRWRAVTDTPARIARRLQQHGMTVDGAYALRPHPARSEMFLPLDTPAALRWFLDDVYVASTRWQVVAEWAVRRLTNGHPARLGTFAPFHATVATMPPRAGLTVAEEAARAIPGIEIARTAMLTDSGNRAVLICFPEGRAASTVVKVPKLAAFSGRTTAEQSVMSAVRAALGPDRDALPSPLGTFAIGHGVTAAAEEMAGGSSMKRTSARWRASWADRAADLEAGTDWITRLHHDHRIAEGVWDDVRRSEVIDTPMREFADRFGLTPHEDELFETTRRAAAALTGCSLPLVWQHRDYSISNVTRRGDTVRVLDWEGGRPGIPVTDMLRFTTSWHEAALGVRTREQRREALLDLGAAIDRSPEKATHAARSALHRYVAGIGVEHGFVAVLQVANWVELALRRFEQQRDAGSLTATTSHAHNRAHNVEVQYVTDLASMRSALFAGAVR